MQISENQVGSVLVLQIRGKILMGEGNVAIKKKIQEKVNAGTKEIVLDLADVPYIDSSGLGELISSYTTVQKAGGRLKLANLTNKIVDLLAITKLVTVFEYYGSVEERSPASSDDVRTRRRRPCHGSGNAGLRVLTGPRHAPGLPGLRRFALSPTPSDRIGGRRCVPRGRSATCPR